MFSKVVTLSSNSFNPSLDDLDWESRSSILLFKTKKEKDAKKQTITKNESMMITLLKQRYNSSAAFFPPYTNLSILLKTA